MIHVHMGAHAHMHAHVHVAVCASACAGVHTGPCVSLNEFARICACACVCGRACTCTPAYMHVHSRICMHVYARALVHVCACELANACKHRPSSCVPLAPKLISSAFCCILSARTDRSSRSLVYKAYLLVHACVCVLCMRACVWGSNSGKHSCSCACVRMCTHTCAAFTVGVHARAYNEPKTAGNVQTM